MPKHPHSYTLRKEWGNDLKYFENVVQYIRDNSFVEYFYGKPYYMFGLNGNKYWTMGAPLNETILINKAENKIEHEYDKIADKYDELFNDKCYFEEEQDLFKIVIVKGSVLDIGCGTVMLLNHISPEEYIGIDPSSKMIEVLKSRHPFYKNNVGCFPLEHYYSDYKFNTIVCLFGTASYINPEAINRVVKNNLAEGGTAYFMYYNNGYYPVTYKKTNTNIKFNHSSEKGVIFNNNYKIVIKTK
jgi:SAM-dependent methyltransferase